MAASLLSSEPLPGPGLAAYAVARGGDVERAAIAGNASVGADVLMDLAERGEDRVARRLRTNASAPREVLVRVLDPVSAWHLLLRNPGMSRPDTRHLLSVVGAMDDPEIPARVLELTRGPGRIPGDTVVLEACLGLLRASGPEAVLEAMSGRKPRTRRAEDDPVHRAYAHPTDPDLLVGALEHEGRTPVVVDRINACWSVDDAVALLRAPRASLDWAYILGRKETLRHPALAALARQVGCPEELRPEPPPAPRRRRRARDGETFVSAHVRQRMMRGLADLEETPNPWLLDAHASGRLSAATILRRGAPAVRALEILERCDDPERVADAHRALAAATSGLGRTPDGWVVALNLVPAFPGTCAELLATARAVVS
ncbi:hypothetical protein LO772_20205 [Yinghuangia sp. ASG 101]|uniref:hypothetical protein n=1 Tax=Yinghuangia sp. ASG 101 TaxID=2896848 RepID=UPI001E52009C|nr:hypothetical protein [Yinghuangia sp. ASG 101]UGQ09269.1 hypothetical protein LO772_20205 [Yinghuangia sp. ASG 101]